MLTGKKYLQVKLSGEHVLFVLKKSIAKATGIIMEKTGLKPGMRLMNEKYKTSNNISAIQIG